MTEKMGGILDRLYLEFGWKTRIMAALSGRVLYHTLKKEEARLAKGWSYEPKPLYEKNAQALALEKNQPKGFDSIAATVRWVTGELSPVFSSISTNAIK